MLSVVMLNVENDAFMLSVVTLRVVAHLKMLIQSHHWLVL